MACLLAFAVIFTCIGSALATVSAETAIVTNANGKSTDVGIWYTPYNCSEFFAHRFADPDSNPVGYRGLLPDGSYGIPFAGDTDIMDFYIEQMAKAGIDFVMFDLTNGGLTDKNSYGWGAENEFAGNRWNVRYSELFAERLSKWNDTHAWKIRYAVSVGTYPDMCEGYEDAGYVANVQAEGVIELFLNDEVIGDDYYIFDGKPLITLFDWTKMASNTTAVMEYIYNETSALSKFTVRSASVGQAGGYSWNNNQNGGAAVYDDEVVTVCPGHALAAASTPNDSRRNGATYKENWDVVLNAEVAPRVVMISSFNDYMENTAVFVTNTDGCVETNAEEKWDNPYQYWDMTVENIAALRAKAGDSTGASTGYVNYALTANVTASAANFDAAGPLAAINNGSTEGRSLTRAMDNSDHEVYITFDLGAATTINNVNLYADNCEAAAYGFKNVAIDALVDGQWVRVAQLHNLSVSNKELVPVYFAPVKATKVAVRVDTDGQENTNYASFAEIEIYNNPTVEEKDYTGFAKPASASYALGGFVSDNYALAGTASTNTSTRGNGGGMWEISKVNNGATTNDFYYGYVSGPSGVNYSKNPYVQIDFDSAKTINSVNFFSCSSGEQKWFNDYAIDVKLTNGAWKRVAARHYSVEGKIVSGNAQKVEFFFETVEALAFRVTCDVKNCQNALSGGDPNGISQIFSCTEVQAFYNSAAPANLTGIAQPTDGVNIPTIKGTNYALGGTTTASDWNQHILNNPENGILTDGKWAGRTASQIGSVKNPWIDIAFTATANINNVSLVWDPEEQYVRKDFAVDVKTADGAYVRVAEVHLDTDPEWARGGKAYEIYFDAIDAAGLRLWFLGNPGELVSLTEVEAYKLLEVPANTGITVPAAGKEIRGISSKNWAAASNGGVASTDMTRTAAGVDAINDGNHTSWGRSLYYWTGARANYYQIDFDGVKTINTIVAVIDYMENYQSKDLFADVQLADGTWKRVSEIHYADAPTWAADWTAYNGGNYEGGANGRVFTFPSVQAKAIRVYGLYATKTGSLFSLSEVEAYNNSGTITYVGIPSGVALDRQLATNVAVGATATDTFATSWGGGAASLVDGSASNQNRSASDFGSAQCANYKIMFTKAAVINTVTLVWDTLEEGRNYSKKDIAIEVITPGGATGLVAELHLDAKPELTTGAYVTTNITFEDVEAAGIRVWFNKADGGLVSLYEIEAYQYAGLTSYTGINKDVDASAAIPTAPEFGAVSENFALGQKVTTSNTNWSLFAGSYPADRLTDGVHGQADTAACAISNYVGGVAHFTVNFDKAHTVNKVVLLLSAHEKDKRPDEFIIDVLTNDGWERVALQGDNDGVTMTFYFAEVECTAVRVVANNKLGAEGGGNFRINEIEAYLDKTVTEDMYTGTTSALAPEYTAVAKQGDVNGDNWVNAIDLAYAVNAYVGATKVPAGNTAIVDTNRDGKYDIRDYIYLVEVLATRDFTLMD